MMDCIVRKATQVLTLITAQVPIDTLILARTSPTTVANIEGISNNITKSKWYWHSKSLFYLHVGISRNHLSLTLCSTASSSSSSSFNFIISRDMWNKKSLFLIKIFVNASCVISVKYVWWMRQRDNPNNKSELKSFFKGLKKIIQMMQQGASFLWFLRMSLLHNFSSSSSWFLPLLHYTLINKI